MSKNKPHWCEDTTQENSVHPRDLQFTFLKKCHNPGQRRFTGEKTTLVKFA